MEQSLSTVSDIVNAIKTTLEFEYADLLLEGEVSNLSLSSAGHYYFSLSDSKASLSCALFKMDALRNPFIRKEVPFKLLLKK
jgi:exodeoxyribonuclease VII large subunit